MLIRSIFALVLASAVYAQAPARNRVIGVVSEIRDSGLTVKTDAGEVVQVSLLPAAKFQKIAPGEKDLSKAQPITAAEIATGDRVLARGAVSEDGKSIAARSVIVMSRTDLAQKEEKERQAWIHRGIAGLVVSADPAANEIRLRVPSILGPVHLATVSVQPGTKFRRYPPDSVRFADAKPSTLAEIQPGDQVRALGEKNEDGTHIAAEEVVSGSFRTVAGAVTTVDAASGRLQMKELGSGKVLTVIVTPDSVLRRAPQFPMMGGGPGAMRPAGPGPEAAAGAAAPRRTPDFQQLFERMPAIPLNEIKPGETIVVSSTRGATPEHLTAVTLLAGADALIARGQAAAARNQGRNNSGEPSLGNWNLGDMSTIPMP